MDTPKFDRAAATLRVDRIACSILAGKIPRSALRPVDKYDEDEDGKRTLVKAYDYEFKVACTAAAIARAIDVAITPRDKTPTPSQGEDSGDDEGGF